MSSHLTPSLLYELHLGNQQIDAQPIDSLRRPRINTSEQAVVRMSAKQ